MFAESDALVMENNEGIDNVGFPDTPSPLETVTWFEVPVIVRPVKVSAAV